METPFLNPDDLTRAILARTSGAACARLKAVACDFVDGVLEATPQELAQAHLEHCPDCARFVAALREAKAVLPAMAEVDPGPWFAQRVMRATAYRPRPTFDARGLWRRLMHRPRIALEAAYVGALAAFAGFSLPTGSLAKELRLPALVQPLGASATRVGSQVVQAERRTVASVRRVLAPQEGSPHLRQRIVLRLRAWFHRADEKTPQAPNR